MDISVHIDGLDRLQTRSRAVQEAVRSEVNVALYAAAKHVEAAAKKSILSGQKSGRPYARRTVVHVASAPGEAPASDTGRLVNSINAELNASEAEATVTAGSGAVRYAAPLEFGTRHIAPRPFLFPALEASKDWITDRLARAVRDALR